MWKGVLDMNKFILKKGTQVIQNESELILRRGFIHKNEIIINKEESSNEFIGSFSKLILKGSVSLLNESNSYDDFDTLVKFGFLTVEVSVKELPLVIVEDKLFLFINEFFKEQASVKKLSDIISTEELNTLIEDKDVLKLAQILNAKSELLSNYGHIYLITNLVNLSLLRGFNKLMSSLGKINTIAFFDNANIFITCIEHKQTGCYECLENQILSNFDGYISDYSNIIENDTSNNEIFFVLSIIKKEIENAFIYGQSSLIGNVIHFNFDNYEYSFNTNRIQSCCTTCSTFNNILFEEQNIRSINILKELAISD